MNNLIIKKNKLQIIPKLLIATLYGCFIVYNLNLDLTNDSGDIWQLIRNAEVKIVDPNLTNEYLFYFLVNLIVSYTVIDYLNIFQIIAFITSAILLYIFISRIKSENYLYYSLLLILIVFCTPRVVDLFASGVRSGFAFTILIFGLNYFKGTSKIILIIISVVLHLSMLPIVGLYLLFTFFNTSGFNFSSSIYYLLLTTFGIFIVFLADYSYPVASVSQSIRYQILIFILSLFFILIAKGAVKDIFGFLAIGIILIVIVGFIFDVSFIRFVGNAILFYLFFLIKENNKKHIRTFFLCYFPFFVITVLYSIPGIIR